MRLAIATINRHAPSETFIRAHVARLPAPVLFLTGGEMPDTASEGLEGPLEPITPSGRVTTPALAAFLKARGVEVLLAEYGPVGVAVGPACHASGIPLVVHFYGYDAYRHDVLSTWGRSYPRLFEQASVIIAISRAMRTQLIALGAPPARTLYNPCGFDERMFSPEPQATRDVAFLGVGRLVAKKGPLHTLRAFRLIAPEFPGARLELVGAGPLEAACRQTIADLDLGARVRLRGAITHEEVAALMRRSCVFLQHSLTGPDNDHEGTPLSILEAAGSAVPVISTRHAGIPEVVTHGETGFLVEEGDVALMARHMRLLSADPGLAQRLGDLARRRALARFTEAACVSRLREILDEVRRSYGAAGRRPLK